MDGGEQKGDSGGVEWVEEGGRGTVEGVEEEQLRGWNRAMDNGVSGMDEGGI